MPFENLLPAGRLFHPQPDPQPFINPSVDAGHHACKIGTDTLFNCRR